jgi:nucleoside recognition membrane protein YjiH
MIATIFAVIGIIFAAISFIALGMALANRYNKIAWNKYYEGMELAGKPVTRRSA